MKKRSRAIVAVSLLLSCLLAVATVTFTASTAYAQAADEFVLHYSNIQHGNVDAREKAVITRSYKDDDMGSVVKITPMPDSTESGCVTIDGYGLADYGIDLSKWKYLTVEYKLTTDYSGDVRPFINFLGGANKGLAKSVTVYSNASLERGKWAYMTFDIGDTVGAVLDATQPVLSHIHFSPLGSAHPSKFAASDSILIRNFTFTTEKPADYTAPAPVEKTEEEEIEIKPIENDTRTEMELHYSKIQHGNVDGKVKATIDRAYKDDEAGSVIKIAPMVDTTEPGNVMIDGYDLARYQVDLSKWKYLSVEYKFVSDYDEDVRPYINFLGGANKGLSKTVTIHSGNVLERDGWATATFDLASNLSEVLDPNYPLLYHIHFAPFGNIAATKFDEGDYILIRNFIFTEAEPDGFVTLDPDAVVQKPEEEEPYVPETREEMTLHYSRIQHGNVDNKTRAVVSNYKENEDDTESVVKIAPDPTTIFSGGIAIDGYGLEPYKIDVTWWNYLTVEYKYVSSYEGEITPSISFLPGSKRVLSKTVSVKANETLKKNEWSTMTFNMGSNVKPLINEDRYHLAQVHFYPFGSVEAKSFKQGDYILIRNFKFMVKNPNGDTYYSVSFDAGDNAAVGEAPASVTAMFDDKIILPEIPFVSEGKIAKGWIPDEGTKVYNSGDEFTMPERNIKFSVVWEEIFKPEDFLELSYPPYFNGVVDRKDTSSAKTVDYEGYSAVEVIPNPASTNGAILLDGYTYAGAKISAKDYNTIAIFYKYESENPVKANAMLNVLKSTVFTESLSNVSREPLATNRWAVASFDISKAKDLLVDPETPFIRQMHILPFSYSNVNTMSADDRFYIAKIFVIPEQSTGVGYHESYINGYADGTFGVNGNMTRAEACTIVARLVAGTDEKVPTDKTSAFADVLPSDWHYKYVAYVESLGYLKSYSGSFLPNQAITRAEFVELVYNMGLLSDKGLNGTFTDVPADHSRAEVISAAGKAGLVNGYANGDGTFSFKPDNTITRAEVVKVINNAYGRKPHADGIFTNAKTIFSDVTPDHWAFAEIIDAAVGHISYYDMNGNEVWKKLLGSDIITEDFTPDYDAGTAKMNEVQALIDKRIAEIRSTPNTAFTVSGTTYYVSSSEGNDSNDGKSEKTPFKTALKAQQSVKAGDLVLYKRGDMWRESWVAMEGVTYSAYGEGEKPFFNGNLYGDAADESLWSLVEGTTNVWMYKNKTADVGNIIVNGNSTLEKMVPVFKDGQHIVGGKVFDPATSMTSNNHFISIYNESFNTDEGATLYVRCDEGNPGKVYDSIEIAHKGHLILVRSNTVIDNIKVMYAGSHGFSVGSIKNCSFRNLEIGYIGGAISGINSGNAVRFGNGIEVYGGCDGYTIENCYVYECYDAGITHQYSSGGNNDVIEQNVLFKGNVIDKCIYNIEYFMGGGAVEAIVRLMKNIEYSDNILARSGYGWGADPGRSASVKGWTHTNKSENFVIKNNIFFLDKMNACDLSAGRDLWLPVFEGNTYIQKYGNTFTKIGANGPRQYVFLGSVAEDLEKRIGEKDFKLFYVPASVDVDK